MNFRHDAREALTRAQTELAAGETGRLKYAALELRMAMEALTYDRAQAFAAELPSSEYDTWQPKKLLQILLEIDPTADKDSSVSYGIEEMLGIPPAVVQSLGTEKVLNLATLKKHYDALGSYLHMPTLGQLRAGKGPEATKLAKRCKEIAALVEDVLASPVFNVTLGNFAKIACAKCGATVRKRLPHGAASVEARCFECPASYTIEVGEGGTVVWHPQQPRLYCAKPGCDGGTFVWRHELAPGRIWICPECSSQNLICLGVSLAEASSSVVGGGT